VKTYCINYNLGNPGRDYKALIERIKSFGHGWCHVGGSHWFANSDLTSAQVRDHLKPALDSTDDVMVHEVGDMWASYQVSAAVVKWLKENWHSSCTVG
jgi:hypothetical protein